MFVEIALIFLLSAGSTINAHQTGKIENGNRWADFMEDDSRNQDSLLRLYSKNLSLSRFISRMNPYELHTLLAKSQDDQARSGKMYELRLLKGEVEKDSKLGFGGPPHASEKRMVFCNATSYINKVINHAQHRLEQIARRIWASNPPQVIDKIPYTSMIFKLKYIEGASSLGTNGTSWAIHYFDEAYVSARYRFDEIRYFYDVQIKPFNLFAIPARLTVVLGDAPATMSFSMEKNKSTIPRFEFVNPQVSVDFGIHRWINYAINYVIHEKYPKMNKKLVKIVSRDTWYLLNDQLKNAQ